MEEHIVLFPFMAQGHLIPFLTLAKLIHNRTGCLVTLLSTPLNIQNLQPSLPPGSNIRLHSLPFNTSDHGLPPAAENTDGLHYTSIVRLYHASHALQSAFDQFLSDFLRSHGRPPLCVVADVFLGWTVQIARRHGILHATFSTCGAYGTAAYFSLWTNLPHTKTESDGFQVPGFPDSFRLHRSQMSVYMRAADGRDPWSTFFPTQIALSLESDGMLCNTVEEMEQFGLKILKKMAKIPVWCIGPLLPASLLQARSPSAYSIPKPSLSRTGKESGIPINDCIQWLNFHPLSSVLYISFGSQNTLPTSHIMKLAIGLESAGHPFIWVIRPPIGHDLESDFRSQWLPPGFEERMREKKQGILVRKWAPQLEILTHGSTGAFLSHCGWNSVLESLSQGVPIIGWPLASEQFYNSKMMVEEMGVCVELARGAVEEITSDRVEQVVGLVMGRTEKAEEMKRKAAGIAETIRASMRDNEGSNGSSICAIEDFVRTARAKSEESAHRKTHLCGDEHSRTQSL